MTNRFYLPENVYPWDFTIWLRDVHGIELERRLYQNNNVYFSNNSGDVQLLWDDSYKWENEYIVGCFYFVTDNTELLSHAILKWS